MPNVHQLFSPAELKSDLSVLIQKTKKIHPDIYYSISETEYSMKVAEITKDLDHPMKRAEYYRIVAPLLASLKDAHTSVDWPRDDWIEFRSKGGRVFPFLVRFIDSIGLTVAGSLDSACVVENGTKILKINSLSADSLFNEFRKYIGAERLSYNSFITAYYFECYLWLNNIIAPFSITFLSSDSSKPKALFSEGIPKRRFTYKPYEYKCLPGNIGYFIYNHMRNDPSEPFDQFLENVFQDLDTSHRKGLIVDLRDNGGGNDAYAREILKYITTTPFRSCSKYYRKVSREYKKQVRSYTPPLLKWVTYPPTVWLGALCTDELKIFTATEGDFLERHFEPKEYTIGSKYYKGKVCFLIGTVTFSSAVDLADAVKTYHLATLIGEETGGIPTAFGDRVHFTLPITGLMVSVASAKFIRADGNELSRDGVLPDIEVHESIFDLYPPCEPHLENDPMECVIYSSTVKTRRIIRVQRKTYGKAGPHVQTDRAIPFSESDPKTIL